MKRIFACLICALMLITLFACSNENNLENGSSNSLEGTSFGSEETSVSQTTSGTHTASGSQTTSGSQTASGSQTTSGSQESGENDEVFNAQDQAIKNFLISGKDVDTVTSFDSVANESSATYANVPDYYLDLTTIRAEDIFASPEGTAQGDGSFQNPYDIYTALSKIEKGKTLFLKEGVYSLSKRINFYKNGTRSQYINIYAYGGGRAVLDFSSMAFGSDNKGMALYSNFVRIYGLDFKAAGDNGLTIIGSYNIIENCMFYDNRDSGLQIMGNGSDFALWPHDNLVLNCTAFNNADVDEGNELATGENADGFACKLANGNNNTFDGCIAYSNIDDGWDLFAQNQANGRTILVNCVAFSNGYMLDGSRTPDADGNGFKLGSWNFPCNSYVANCIAFDNYDSGFTCNCNVGAFEMYNCTAYNNSLKGLNEANNYNLGRQGYDCKERFLSNLLSISSNTCKDKATGTIRNSLFTLNDKGYYFIESVDRLEKTAVETYGKSKNFSNEDMVESVLSPKIDAQIHYSLRNEDLTINLGSFLKVKENSPIATMGLNNSPLGANLHRDNYFTKEEVKKLINEIGLVTTSSQSFSKIYKATKYYCSLEKDERESLLEREVLAKAINDYNKNL